MRSKLLAALLGCVALQGCVNPIGLVVPIPHSGDAIHTRVVDAHTGKPLDNVLVLAVWKDWTPGLVGGSIETGEPPHCIGVVNLQSVTSADDGTVLLPAWSHLGHCANLYGWMPKIYFYRPGYRLLEFQNNSNIELGTMASYYSTEELDGKTVELESLGPHDFNEAQDRQVTELHRLDLILRESLYTYNSSSECFWVEARPAMLMLVREKRRLSGYMPTGLTFLDDDLKQGTRDSELSCGDQRAYVQSLAREAQDIQPDVVRSPTVSMDTHDYHQPIVKMASSTPDVGAGSAVDQTFAKTGVIYHVQVDPQNPSYMVVTMVLPPVQQILQEYALTKDAMGVPDRNYDYRCSSISGEPSCRWVVAFSIVGNEPNYKFILQRSSAPTYDSVERRWALKPTMFIRPLITAPEFIEIDGPDTLSITSDLEQVAPRLWRLPGRTVSYSMTIESPQAK